METIKFTNKKIIDELIETSKNFDSTKENYLVSYPHFLNYFKNIEVINMENIIIGISFAYSWMPRILKSIKLENHEKIISIMKEVKDNKVINADQLLTLKAAFDNSLVGVSKLLHFINPEKYAIWDSRVYRYLYKQEPHNNRIGNVQNYFEYLKTLEDLTKEEGFNDFLKIVSSKLEHKPTNFRALELIMFIKGKK